MNDVVPLRPRAVELSVASAEDFRSLHLWLQGLRGISVDAVAAVVHPGDQGVGWDMMSVAFGSGGAGIAVLHTVRTWVESRRSAVRIRVRGSGDGRDVQLDASNVEEIMPLLTRMLDVPG